ncbi:signal peptide peptidase SppA [Naumannella halotolerans]|uniref:Protease-4 n=1 Tax=Naumannella halotolerans TaxID=993414 RepID=A0A4R7JB74_9ACTN|nr:signal peptide peptidase SppA [Naumannella halotolerans]TDT33907.1 protease-4 [Naumannella halotolerans]
MDVTSVIREGAQQVQQMLRKESGDHPLVLELDLTRGVIDAMPQNPVAMFLARQLPSLGAIRRALRTAADDPKVTGLVIDLGALPVQAYVADELAALIEAFGEKKPVIAFASSFGEVSSGLFAFRLAASAADVWVQPSGAVNLSGVHAQILLLRGGLEKLGVSPEFAQRWEYKSAGEQFAGSEVSEANREMTRRLAESLLESATDAIAHGRDLSTEQVRTSVDDTMVPAAEALNRGLIDHVGYRDEVYAWVRQNWGVDEQINLQYVQRYAEKHGGGPLAPLLQKTKPAVGVVSVHGAIVSGASRPGGPTGEPTAGSDTVCAALRAAGRDDSVKAVVLRVDSPGGSYVASDAIRREVLQLREAGKPVVASMGAVAASGGYFVSMPAAEIIANPSTLTGSIGVLAGKLVTQGLVDKLGLVREAVDAGRNAGMLSGSQPFTEEQWDKLNGWLDEVYTDFTTKAATDRALPVEALDAVAKGRVWTGADAAEKGLVDHLGGLDLAIERVCALADLDRDAQVVRPVPSLGMLSHLRPSENSESLAAAQASGLPQFSGWEGLLAFGAGMLGVSHRGVLSMPFDVRIS